MGFRVQGKHFVVEVLGFRAYRALAFGIWCLVLGVWSLEFGVGGLGDGTYPSASPFGPPPLPLPASIPWLEFGDQGFEIVSGR